MKKRIIAMTLTAAALASLCACGVNKPDIEAVTKQPKSSEGASVTVTEKKRLTVKNNSIKGDMSEKFHVNADIINGDKTSMPTYVLSKTNMTPDQFAEKLMSDPDYNRDEIDNSIVVFSNDKEKLVVDLDSIGKQSNPLEASPNITYALDKGKEFEAALKSQAPYNKLETTAAKQALAQVKEMLDKLPITYDDDFYVDMIDYTTLNMYYSFCVGGDAPGLPDDITDQIDTNPPASLRTDQILLYSEGRDAVLDKDFKFTKDDNGFVIKGKLKLNDMPVESSFCSPYSITAAVSSRGVEYLYVENLYVSDNGSSDSSIVTPEQAVEAAYHDYDVSSGKDKYEVFVRNVSLTYLKENGLSDSGSAIASKAVLKPVWKVSMDITNVEEGYGTFSETQVYADSGKIMVSSFLQGDEKIINYAEPSAES